MRRRSMRQGDKDRAIDNARTSGHNQAAALSETIHTVPFDVGALVARALREEAGRALAGPRQSTLGSYDMRDAYRSIPNAASQEAVCIIAYRDLASGNILFAVAAARLFGFSAAVNNFNRVPELLIAWSRRVGAAMTWHCFDDAGGLELICE